MLPLDGKSLKWLGPESFAEGSFFGGVFNCQGTLVSDLELVGSSPSRDLNFSVYDSITVLHIFV